MVKLPERKMKFEIECMTVWIRQSGRLSDTYREHMPILLQDRKQKAQEKSGRVKLELQKMAVCL